MSWQLWVVITLVATGIVILAVTRMRHAQHVFTDITRLDGSAESKRPRLSGDELARARAARSRGTESDASPRRGHG